MAYTVNLSYNTKHKYYFLTATSATMIVRYLSPISEV